MTRRVRSLNVRFQNRIPASQPRKIYMGGVFAPPGDEEIVHVSCMNMIDFLGQGNFSGWTWQATTNNNQRHSFPAITTGGNGVMPYRLANPSEWGITNIKNWLPLFYPFNNLPDSSKPIYINPNHYMPYEITITKAGDPTNNSLGGVTIYFYKLNTTVNDPFYFHDTTIEPRTGNLFVRGMMFLIHGSWTYFGARILEEQASSVGLFSLPSSNLDGRGFVQSEYFGSSSIDVMNNTPLFQTLSTHSYSIRFPLRHGLVDSNSPTKLSEDLRIVIIPTLFFRILDSTNGWLEHNPYVGVEVKCIANR